MIRFTNFTENQPLQAPKNAIIRHTVAWKSINIGIQIKWELDIIASLKASSSGFSILEDFLLKISIIFVVVAVIKNARNMG